MQAESNGIQVSLVKKVTAIVVVAFLQLLGIAVGLVNPLRRPTPAVRAWLLSKVPVASSQKALYQVAVTMGWQIRGGAELDSCWEFDELGRLIDVHIPRMADAP